MEELDSGEDQYAEVWKLCCEESGDGTKVNAFRRSHFFLKDILRKEIHKKVKAISVDSEIIGGQCDSFESWKEFSSTVGELESLETLSFSCFFRSWDVSDRSGVTPENDECSRLAYAVSKAKQIKNLKVSGSFSYLENSDAGGGWDAKMMSLFGRALIGHPTLEVFEMVEFDYDDARSLEFLLHALSTVPNLRSVTLTPGQIDLPYDELEYHAMCDGYFLARLVSVPTLCHLCLQNFYLDEDGCRTLGKSLSAPDSAISELDLFFCLLHGPELFDAMKDCRTLNELRLRSVRLETGSERALDKLARYNKSISALHLGDGTFLEDPVTLRGTLSALAANSSIRNLSISENEDALMSTVGVDWPEVIRLVRRCLKANLNLETLDLCQNGFTDAVADDLVMMIADDNDLKKLSIGCNDFTDAGWTKLLSGINQSQTLEYIAIDGYVPQEALAAFVAGLPKRTSLKSLALGIRTGDILSRSSAQAVFDALRENYGLENLKVNVDDEYKKKIATILRLNKAGRRYLLNREDASVAAKGLHVLASVGGNLNDIFYHLRYENPSLCDLAEPTLVCRKRKRR